MKRICIVKTKNTTVTFHNFEIFKYCFEENNCDVIETFWQKAIPNADYYLASDLLSAAKLIVRNKKVLYWMQGIQPEESIIENNNKVYYYIWSCIEKYVVNRVKYVWFVSSEMKKHIENKYSINISKKSAVFPCYNTEIHKDSFFKDGKYSENVFVYAGGLTPWQCFDEILDIYKKIEQSFSGVRLLLLARDQDAASRKAQEKDIKNYSVDYVSPEELPNRLSCTKFGFIIRKDDPVNKVATPTKISSYLSNGVIPIYTSSIGDFGKIAEKMHYVVKYDDANFMHKLQLLLNQDIASCDVFSEYSDLFDDYFSDKKYIAEITKSLSEVLSSE